MDKGFQECPRSCPRAFSTNEYYSEYARSTVVVHGIGNVDSGQWTVFDNTSRIAQTSLKVGLGSLPAGLVNLLEKQLWQNPWKESFGHQVTRNVGAVEKNLVSLLHWLVSSITAQEA